MPSELVRAAEALRRCNLPTPRITVGLPVYKGADLIAKALDCLQGQTFGNFEGIISVDGSDAETVAACRPFLADPRFRMVVHPKRLDWVGNFNWLLQQDLKEFFCYRQHDDSTAPEFFEILLQAAEKEPSAAAIYCDCQFSGERNDLETAPSIEGNALHRMDRYIETCPLSAAPVRGLIRRAAIRQAGLVRSDEFRAPLEVFVWLAKLLRWGNFRRVAKPLYYRLDHPHSFSRAFERSPEDRKRVVWTTLITGLLEAAVPFCHSPEERLFFQQTILHRLVANPPFYPRDETYSSKRLINECLERLRYEGNAHLLNMEELPEVLQEFMDEDKLLERSQLRRGLNQIRRGSRMARFIYPKSRWRRVAYQTRYILWKLRQRVARWFRF